MKAFPPYALYMRAKKILTVSRSISFARLWSEYREGAFIARAKLIDSRILCNLNSITLITINIIYDSNTNDAR